MNVILIVEDEEMVRENLCELLTEKKYEVLMASNGAEAVEILKHFKVDLIISDLMMPVMDGIEFMKILKTTDEWKVIPVIVLSAKSESSILQFCVQNMIAEYISKPYDAGIIYKAVAGNIK